MIIVIGEILIDRFPDYERIGGAPFNFAFHLKKLGWPVRFITRVGDDSQGRQICRLLDENGFNLEDVQIDGDHMSGRVDVSLDARGVPNFTICEDVAYDHLDLSSCGPSTGRTTEMIYFGTLIQRTANGRAQVQRFLEQDATGARTFCDINLRAPHYNASVIEGSLRHADILKLNDEELATIATLCNGPPQAEAAVDWLKQVYNVSTIALTHGADGSTVFAQSNTAAPPPAKATHIVDTVGAGDAYASVLAAGLLKDLPLEWAVELAAGFAAHICGLPGATPQSADVYTDLLKEVKRISNGP